MFHKTGIMAGLLALGLFVVACGDDDNPAPSSASLRVIHASYDGPPVDIYVDGQLAIEDLAFGESSGFATVAAGTRAVKVTVANGSATLIDKSFTLTADTDYTVFALNKATSLEELVSGDSRAPMAGKAKVRFLHAAPDAPAVDIRLQRGDGARLFGNVAFKGLTPYVDVDAASVSLVVTAAGQTDAVVSYDPIALEQGKVYTVLALGTLQADDMYPFTVRAFVDNEAGRSSVDLQPKQPETKQMAEVMVIHASPDAPGVDLLVDDRKLNDQALGFTGNTGYLELEAGERNFKINVAGTSTTAINADIDLEADTSYSLFAVGRVASIEPLLVIDNLAAPAAGQAHVRFIHLSPDAPAVDIVAQGAGTLFASSEFKDVAAFTPVPAGTYNIDVQLAGRGPTVLSLADLELQDGKIYTIFAKGLVSDGSLGAEIIVNN